MKILFLMSQYLPYGMANTICAIKYANALKAHNHKVDFVSITQKFTDVDYLDKDSKVYFIDNYLTKLQKKYNSEKLPKTAVFFAKIKTRIKSMFCKNTKNFLVDFVDTKKLIKIASDGYDAIVSVSEPLAIQNLAYKIKSKIKNIKWYPLFLDPLVYNYNSKEFGTKRIKNKAEKLLQKADKIFAVYGIKKENEKLKYLPNYHSKMVDIYLPSLVEPNVEIKNLDSGKNEKEIKMLYAGMFHEKVRNPKKMFDLLEKVKADNANFVCIGYGCEDAINAFAPKSIKFNYLNKQPYSVVVNNILDSDILINLGNSVPNQMPSKVLEYISYGKPIINFVLKSRLDFEYLYIFFGVQN